LERESVTGTRRFQPCFIGRNFSRADRSAFAHYDPDQKAWVADKGACKIPVAGSSRDLRLTGEFKLTETTVEK
jgi:hypothetical protein